MPADRQWFLVERLGRRFLTLWGMIGLTVLLLAGGATATLGTVAGNKATISFILVYCWFYNVTIGATSWIAASEIGTSRLRNKTAGLGLATQGVLAVSKLRQSPLRCDHNPEANVGTG